MQTNDGMRGRKGRRMPSVTSILERYWRGELELLDELSTWFLQYFFMSLFDMPELLAFCCAMQSFICSFLAA